MTAKKKIVVGVDGAEAALHAVRWAADWGGDGRAEIWLTAVVEEKLQVSEAVWDQVKPTLAAAALENIEEAERGLPETVLEHVNREVRFGDPAKTLLAFAGTVRADMIVLGSHGKGRLASLLLGSVTQSVIAKGKCAVVVVH